MESCKSICLETISETKSGFNSEYKNEMHEGGSNLQDEDISNDSSSSNTRSKNNFDLGGKSGVFNKNVSTTRPFDLVIFAASSSVGKFLVEELALVVDKHYGNQSSEPKESSQSTITSTSSLRELRSPMQFAQTNRRSSVPKHVDGIRWAVGGRSAMRISETLCQAELSTGIKDLSSRVPILLADLQHHKSLLEMCSKTSLVINCAGPYSIEGESLIKACVESKTNYIDLSHETNFIERVRQKYSNAARDSGIYIINGCGFQSMSAEMGLNFIKQVVDGQIEQVKIILNLSNTKAINSRSNGVEGSKCGIVTKGMWNSLINDKTPTYPDEAWKISRYAKSRSGFDEKYIHKRKDTQSLVTDVVELHNRYSSTWLQLFNGFEEQGRKSCLPISSLSSDESQLIRGEMSNYEHRKPDLDSKEGWKPIRCSTFISMRSVVETVIMLIWLVAFNFLVRFSITRWFLRALPNISSLGHVNSSNRKLDRDSLGHIKFCQTFLAYGTPGNESGDPMEERDKNIKRKQEQLLIARVVGPEPNHVTTSSYAIQAALAVILERDHLPSGGGVMTPGTAFAETNIIYQLRRRNIKFEVLKKA